MIYFDSACLAKLYLDEPDADPVKELADASEIVACCAHGRIELAYVFHRKMREGVISRAGLAARLKQVENDAERGFLCWLPVNDALLQAASRSALVIDKKTFLRAADALHLACAPDHGFREIYSNDKHLLAAAKHFGLRGKNVITGPLPKK